MAIKLSLNKTLYSYDGQLEAYVTDTTVVKVQIYTDYNLSDSVLVYQQGDVQDSVAIINNVAEIPGMNLRSGQLSVAVLYDNTLSNFVQIYATKAAALSQNLVDDDPYFTVDRNKRLVSVPGTQDMLAVNFDENSEVITFKFPRYADGVDLSTKEIYVNYERSDKTRNKALCTLTDTSDSYVIFTWVVSAYATQVEGTLNFNIEFRSVDYRWQTQPTSLLVYRSLLYTGEAVPDQPELLDQYLDMFVELNSHPPIPGDDGYWRIWSLDTHSYETSEFPLQAGKDGITPTIGDNGNWYLGATDTGKPSRGKTGAKGAAGKSAYQYAQDGGYTGTEAEFSAKLAQDFPASVTAEAKRVAQNVQGVRTGKSLTFVACSDVHLNISEAKKGGTTLYAATLKSLKMAGQGVRALRNVMPLDAAVVLGDFTWADASYTVAKCKGDFTECIQNFSEAMSGIPSAWLVGNHDINYGASRDRTLTEDEIYAYIGANSTGVTSDPDHQEKNYYYKDFDGQKIRMIFLNTCDALTEYTPTAGSKAKSEWMSAVQLQWLADTALDFSDKADASQWGVVVCSHHPVDYGDAMKRACMILEAYKAGTSGNISYTDGNGGSQSIAYNFTAGEKAEIICNIHGHSHNFGYKKISSSNSVTPWLWRVCIPCINCGRENEQATNADLAGKYGEFDAEGNPVYYRKAEWSDAISGWVYNAEKGTSFCVVTIDRKTKKIYAHYFGVGRDRTIAYGESTGEPETPSYTNLVPTSEAMDSTAVYNGGLGYRDGYYISSGSGGDSAKSGHATTGMIAYPNVAGGKTPPTIYLKGGTISRIGLYYADKSFKMTLSGNGFTTVHFTSEQLDTGYYKLTPVMLTDGSNNSSLYNTFGNISYLRFDVVCTTGADLIITLDEPIV